ncbi:hypothetical protein LXA43DRAFT_1178777 [Ganoderma leucocontextum]|nr:hypothetical protein LXA43DRAFT_1178777 [Ganoderma leucocontextum]
MSADCEEARPQKRPRTAEETNLQSSTTDTAAASGNLNNLKRHEEFWFDDGSIILVTRRTTAFRVYRALLAAQSTVFADMFSSSSPSAEEMMEGCPVVHLSDAPKDVAHFLRVLLPKSQRLLYSRKTTFSFHQISAVIRLAHKYDVQDVLDQAIESFQEYFTSDFDTWTRGSGGVVRLRSQHAIGVVNLARLVDRPALLPIAFYKCALLGGDVVDGYRREDRTMEYLCRKDVKRCIDGRNELAEHAIVVVSAVFGFTQPGEECASPVRCRSALQSMLELVVEDECASDADVLASWEGRIHDWAEDLSLCNLCEKAAVERDVRARRQVWYELPEIFDVEVEGWVPSEGDGDEVTGDTP